LARTLVEAREAVSEEAFAPLAHDGPGDIQALADHLVGQAVGREQHDLGAHDFAIR
jgi:hypothetical protein